MHNTLPSTLVAGLAAGALALTTACTTSEPSATTAEPARPTFTLPDGWFEMTGYGTVLEVDGDTVTPHHVTATTCTVGDPFANELDVDHVDEDLLGNLVVDLSGPTTDYLLSPTTPLDSCDSPASQSLRALAEVFEVHYPFLVERGVDLPSELSAIAADAGADLEHLDDAFTSFALRLGDGHTLPEGVDVEFDLAAFGVADLDDVPALAELIEGEVAASAARLVDGHDDGRDTAWWGRLGPDPDTDRAPDPTTVGYLAVAGFEGLGDGDAVADRAALGRTLDEAFADLADADALIVDLRFNPGGWEDLAVELAGHFVTEPTPAYRKWAHAERDATLQDVVVEPLASPFAGPVVVLTSPLTASAGEIAALALVEVADAVVVGRPSFGEFSDAIDWRLPDGTEFTMSMEVYEDLDGRNHETTGVPVDVDVPFDRTLDAAVDTAVERITGS